jgi:hypothetical protein
VFHDDEVLVSDVEGGNEFGVPRPLDDVFAPAVELVVVVGVVELLGRVDVAGVDDAGTCLPGAGDEVGHRFDGVTTRRRVEAPVGVTEAVLHVDHDEGRS